MEAIALPIPISCYISNLPRGKWRAAAQVAEPDTLRMVVRNRGGWAVVGFRKCFGPQRKTIPWICFRVTCRKKAIFPTKTTANNWTPFSAISHFSPPQHLAEMHHLVFHTPTNPPSFGPVSSFTSLATGAQQPRDRARCFPPVGTVGSSSNHCTPLAQDQEELIQIITL